ncbi:alpha/beta fold hydrolase [Granulicella sibirica]|uniref:Hydrolase n=1 Tax=Granulicella sibirica TaxID=2479048 RepID=A0A4Q0TA75_9BACT|nr:alpha/beta hydrolase [Granulicella sibirica]RXH58899.1 Hydrolase [Granulicella sibirica]
MPAITSIPHIALRTIQADGIEIFYRESGPTDAPLLLLLHGYPTSSHMFRNLIPRLASKYHIIAPDLPGFGFTTVPPERNYTYTFDNLATTLEAFTEALSLKHYALYIFDYGAPTGLRLAVAHPERVTALISQNGNAYLEGLGSAWDPIKTYWANPIPANREALRGFLALEGTRFQYVHGVADPASVPPESYYLDQALMDRPGNTEIQLDLILDYRNNLDLYPAFQHFFRESQPPTLVIWGKNDPFFIPPGAEAFQRDLPMATVRFLDTGHFALETHPDEIAEAIDELLTTELSQETL